MIEKLHNLADTILGINNLKQFDNEYHLIIVNPKKYSVKLILNNEIVKPIKVGRNNTYTYNLSPGVYSLLCQEQVSDELIKTIYTEDIFVPSNLLGTSRVIEI